MDTRELKLTGPNESECFSCVFGALGLAYGKANGLRMFWLIGWTLVLAVIS